MKLKFAMVGGGGGFIGNVHRVGATLDNLAVLTAGCFSRDDEKNRDYANLWGVQAERTYKDYDELIDAESKRTGDDRLDFIVIVTPNVTHFDIAKKSLENGFHVVCDKPVAMNSTQASELEKLAKEKNKLFAVTYTYANYSMVREAQHIVSSGEIGNIINIVAEYPQDWLLVDLQDPDFLKKAWRFDKEQAGDSAATADIGTHIIALIEAITSLKLESVLARFIKIPAHMPLESNTQIMLKYENDIPGLIWASQTAIGHECGVGLRVFGDKGAIEWTHEKPNQLKVTKLDQPTQYFTPNRAYLSPQSKNMARLPAGHPEGYFEAFANIYRDFCTHLTEVKQGLPATKHYYQTVTDGLNGVKFVESCIESNANNNIWVDIK